MATILPFPSAGSESGEKRSSDVYFSEETCNKRPKDYVLERPGRLLLNEFEGNKRPADVPDSVASVVRNMSRSDLRFRDFEYEGMPVPYNVADYGIGVSVNSESAHSDGWFMLLYSNDYYEFQNFPWRCVGFAVFEPKTKSFNSLLAKRIWLAAQKTLSETNAGGIGGNVTVEYSTYCGVMANRRPKIIYELRCSWTPYEIDENSSKPVLCDGIEQLKIWSEIIHSVGTLR